MIPLFILGVLLPQAFPSWITYIKQRIDANKNFLCCITGPTGSGKSWASLSFAEMLSKAFGKTFGIDHVVFSARELMALVSSGLLKPGEVIVWEEVGVGLSSRNWQSTLNKILLFLLQTFRHQRLILIMNCPYVDFLDAGSRKLLHAELQTLSINYVAQSVKTKPMLIQYNSRMQKFYYKYLRVRTERGYAPVNRWNIKKPSDELIKVYEKKKSAFTQQLNQEIVNDLNSLEKDKTQKNELTRALTDKQQGIVDQLKQGKTIPELAQFFNIRMKAIYEQIRLIKKKGVSIKPKREGMKVVSYVVVGA